MSLSLHLWPRWSFAYGRYAKVHRQHGGPIAEISARQSVRLGSSVFEAFATLDSDLTGYTRGTNRLYGNAHGSGTATTKAEAVYRAISEALERWAWHAAHAAHAALADHTAHGAVTDHRPPPGPGSSSSKGASVGLEIDSTTTGFAAFPGLGAMSARLPAYLEAAERWCLGQWWEGRLSHNALPTTPWRGVEGIEILSPIPGTKVAVLWKPEGTLAAYGFAAGLSLESAVAKASVELGRNLHVLDYFRKSRGTTAGLPATLTERRLVYFASAEGQRKFAKRAESPAPSQLLAPPLLVDLPVIGPWSRYTHVWRCLFDPGQLCDDGSDSYFHF